jgi:hypothetical protein
MATVESSVASPTLNPEDRWRAIKQRSTKGLLLWIREQERIHQVEDGIFVVPSETTGGFYVVSLDESRCNCPNHEWFGSRFDVACKHQVAAAISVAKRRRRGCPACFGGWITITVEEDGIEHEETARCRRCSS